MDVLDTGDDETHFTGLEVGRLGVLGGEHPDTVDLMNLAGGLDQYLVAFLDTPVAYPHQGHHTQVVIEPGVDDQRLQWCIHFALRRRNDLDQVLQHIDDPHAALGTARHGIGRIDADDVFDFILDPLRLSLRQVHLVEHRHDFQALLNRRIAVGH